MNNLAANSIDVSFTPALVSGSTYTNTWGVTFAAAMGNVPVMTIGEADADLSSVGAAVSITTVQVRWKLLKGTLMSGCKHVEFVVASVIFAFKLAEAFPKLTTLQFPCMEACGWGTRRRRHICTQYHSSKICRSGWKYSHNSNFKANTANILITLRRERVKSAGWKRDRGRFSSGFRRLHDVHHCLRC